MMSKNKERANTKREERKGEQGYKRDLATQEAREDWKWKPTEQRKQLLEDIKTKIEQANQNEDKRERDLLELEKRLGRAGQQRRQTLYEIHKMERTKA